MKETDIKPEVSEDETQTQEVAETKHFWQRMGMLGWFLAIVGLGQ